MKMPTHEVPWIKVSERYPTVEEWQTHKIATAYLDSEWAPQDWQIEVRDDINPCEWDDLTEKSRPTHWTYARLIAPESKS